MAVAVFGLIPDHAGAANTPPSIPPISNQVTIQSLPIRISFTVWDAETPADRLSLRLVSSNPTLLPEVDACGTMDAGFCFSGSGSNRTLMLRPDGTNFGEAVITVTVADDAGATATNSFWLTVMVLQPHLSVSGIPDQTTDENTSTPAIPFRVQYTGFRTGELSVKGTSSDQSLIPDPNIVFVDSISNRTVTITPTPNRFGQAVITVYASDGEVKGAWSFLLTVKGRLQIALAGRNQVVTWTVTNAALQEARQITGPWMDIVPVASSPYTATTSETKFYRLQKL